MRKFYNPSQTNFIILLPLAMQMMNSGDAMPAKDIREAFVGNTVVAQLDGGHLPNRHTNDLGQRPRAPSRPSGYAPAAGTNKCLAFIIP